MKPNLARMFKRREKIGPADYAAATVRGIMTAMLDTPLQHKVVVEHKPRPPQPRPTRMWFVFSDHQGRRWTGMPQAINGQYIAAYPFPLSWLSGRPDDHEQVMVDVHFEYDDRRF